MIENFQLLFMGLAEAFQPANLLAAVFGAVLGVFMGALPGIGSLAGVALLLPLTFKMNPTTAIIMLATLYYSNMYGSSFSAILLNIPGDSVAVMTTQDGYPLARKGMAGKAMFTSNISSWIGGTIGILVLTVLGPTAAKLGLKFGPAELAWLIILALSSIGGLLGQNALAGLLATAIGIAFSTVGIGAALGQTRYTFGNVNMFSGLAFLSLVIGLFGFGQVIEMVANRKAYTSAEFRRLSIKESFLTRQEVKSVMPTILRCSVLGCGIGVLPGAGSTMAAFLGYILEKRVGSARDKMGTGVLQGVAAPETANSTSAIVSFAPLLALGIPGSGTGAVLLGGLMMWGLQPGPLLFTNNPEFAWGLIGSMYIGNLICLVVSILVIPIMMNVVLVPPGVLIPIISAVCVIGTYTNRNNMFDVGLMITMGVFAYFMHKAKVPEAPLLLAFVLTPMLEMYMRQSFDISSGTLSIFFRSSISLVLILLIVIFMFGPFIIKAFGKMRRKGKTSA